MCTFWTLCSHVCEPNLSWKVVKTSFVSPGKPWNLVFASPGKSWKTLLYCLYEPCISHLLQHKHLLIKTYPVRSRIPQWLDEQLECFLVWNVILTKYFHFVVMHILWYSTICSIILLIRCMLFCGWVCELVITSGADISIVLSLLSTNTCNSTCLCFFSLAECELMPAA